VDVGVDELTQSIDIVCMVAAVIEEICFGGVCGRYLVVRNVPALGCIDELVKLFALYGPIEEYVTPLGSFHGVLIGDSLESLVHVVAVVCIELVHWDIFSKTQGWGIF
jgi:hypothetical protein